MIHYYIPIEISRHYIFSIENSIGNFKCIITDNKPSPLSSSSISQQKQHPSLSFVTNLDPILTNRVTSTLNSVSIPILV
jgi:hypothetical protein